MPCGTNSEKKCKPCFQKPTISTIEKLMIASTPVTVKWLVTVKGCTPDDAERQHAEHVGDQDEHEQREDVGRELALPFGPIFASIMLVTKPVKLSTAICQRPGTSSRFMPPSMNTHSTTSVEHHPQRGIGERDIVAADHQMLAEQGLDQELVHRIDLA